MRYICILTRINLYWQRININRLYIWVELHYSVIYFSCQYWYFLIIYIFFFFNTDERETIYIALLLHYKWVVLDLGEGTSGYVDHSTVGIWAFLSLEKIKKKHKHIVPTLGRCIFISPGHQISSIQRCTWG
jgi:hypothetical protein